MCVIQESLVLAASEGAGDFLMSCGGDRIIDFVGFYSK